MTQNKDEKEKLTQEPHGDAWEAMRYSRIGCTIFHALIFCMVAFLLNWLIPYLTSAFGNALPFSDSLPIFLLAGIAGSVVADKEREARFFERHYKPTMTAQAAPKTDEQQ